MCSGLLYWRAWNTKERLCPCMTVGGNLTDPYALVPRCGVVVEHQLLSVFMDLFRDVGTADKTRTKCLFFYWKLSFTHVWQWFILINFFFLIHIIYTWIYHPSLQVWLLPLFSLILKKKTNIFRQCLTQQFVLLKSGESLQAEDKPLHPNHTAERTSAHWHYSHTFLEHFFPLLIYFRFAAL